MNNHPVHTKRYIIPINKARLVKFISKFVYIKNVKPTLFQF